MAPLERDSLSARQVAANRKNAGESTGPRTEAGKRNVAGNALKHGLYAQMFLESMKALGEDPEAFEELHQGLRESIRPQSLLEEELVADLAKLWWKKARAERAQAAFLASELEGFERSRALRHHELNQEPYSEEEIWEQGPRRSRNSVAKYHQILGPLQLVLRGVEKRAWTNEARQALRMIYGRNPTWRGALIIDMYDQLYEAATREATAGRADSVDGPGKPEDAGRASAGDPGPRGAAEAPERAGQTEVASRPDGCRPSIGKCDPQSLYAALKQFLREEIQDVRDEYQLFRDEHVTISPAMRLAQLAPGGGGRWTLILRQEASLARQIDRKLRLLMKLRQELKVEGPKVKEGRPGGAAGGVDISSASARSPGSPGSLQDSGPPQMAATRAILKMKKQSRYLAENTGAARIGERRLAPWHSGRRARLWCQGRGVSRQLSIRKRVGRLGSVPCKQSKALGWVWAPRRSAAATRDRHVCARVPHGEDLRPQARPPTPG